MFTLKGTPAKARVDLEVKGMKGSPYTPKFQTWTLTIGWFSVIPRIYIGKGGFTILQTCIQRILHIAQELGEEWRL